MAFLGSFLKVVSIGLFIASIPYGGGLLGTALTIGAMVTGTIGSMLNRPKIPEQQQQIGMTLDPGSPLPVVYGRAKVGSICADWFLDPDTQSKVLYQVVALCHGSRDGGGIAAIEELWLDGRLAVVNPTSGELAESGGNDVREHPYVPVSLDYKLFLGTANQTIGNTDLSGLFVAAGTKSPSDVTDSDWDATDDKGNGIAALSLRFNNYPAYVVLGGGNDKAMQPIYSGPPAVTAIVRGLFVEDPRAEVSGVNITFANVNPDTITRASGDFTTEGWAAGDRVAVTGAAINNGNFTIASVAATVLTLIASNAVVNEGPSAGITLTRWASPDNGGDNPALCIRDYLLSPIYGWGSHVSAAMIDEDSFATAADYCDELIDYPLTAGNDNTTRLTCNGVLDTGRTLQQNLDTLKTACRGDVIWQGGVAHLKIRSEEVTPSGLALTPRNIVGQWSFQNAGNAERWNLVTASYVDPLNGEFKAAQTQWPPIGSNSYLTADNDFLNRLDLSLPFTNDQAMAQMIAQITLNEARAGISCQVTCTEEAIIATVGDLVTVTHDTPGWDAKPFWVAHVELLSNTNVRLSLTEYQPDAYALDTMEDRRTYAATSHVPATPETVYLLDQDYGAADLIRNGNFAALGNWWSFSNGAVIDTGADRYTGVASVKLPLTTSGPPPSKPTLRGNFIYEGSAGLLVRVQPGETLRVTAAMKVSAGITTVSLGILITEYDSDGVFLRTIASSTWSQTDTTWTVKNADVAISGDAYYFFFFIGQLTNSTHAGNAWVDEIHIFRKAAP